MSQSFVKFYAHIVFHTKCNMKFILEDTESELYSYLGGILKNCKSIPLKIGGTSDHIHILCTLPKTMSLADLTEEIKKSSSKWIKTKGPSYSNFYWQNGYGGFSVGWSQVETVKHYISNQKMHHGKESFLDEYMRLLTENGIEYKEMYL
ncbi:MAG TPA: IS200/IS605 family transposase [Bacteroidales bacterium]|nr:IS200/IS605 family transposase [Bacteroidales bacterium]